MKKFITLMMVLSLSAFYVSAQDIVSTDPENKNVVLEEFTGIYCGYCPQGHAIAQSIRDAHPDDVVLIAVHTGSYAEPTGSDPDFRTPFGAAIAGQAGVVGYPAGTVNRHLWPSWSQGTGTAMSRGEWTSASNVILNEASYLNVGLEATIVRSTRQLVVQVEVYYTGDSPESTNKLNVAILQDNIVAYQNGGSSNYNHMHMLRWMLTGQWGVEITETTEGSLYQKTFAYEIPEDYNDVEVDLDNLEIVAFVAESTQEIISGNYDHEITYIESNDYDAAITTAAVPQTACSEVIEPVITLKNYGEIDLTSLEFKYSVNNGEEQSFSWTGNLSQLEDEEVVLPAVSYVPSDDNNIVIECEMPNGNQDELPQNDYFGQIITGSQNFEQTIYFGLKIDGNSDQVTWNIADADGSVVAEGGPYANNGFFISPVTFPETGCYMLTVNDASGEGLSGGFYLITDGNNDIIWEGNDFTYTAKADLAHGITVDIDENLLADDINVFPNPVNGNATIEFSIYDDSDVSISLYDVIGKNVMNIYEGRLQNGPNKVNMNTSDINKGVYFVRVKAGNSIVTKKVIVN